MCHLNQMVAVVAVVASSTPLEWLHCWCWDVQMDAAVVELSDPVQAESIIDDLK